MTAPTERTLLVLRHSKSDWTGGQADIDRTLNPRGQGQAQDVGSWLAEQFPVIDMTVVSPATRTRATWALVSAELANSPEARVDERAYAASVTDLLEIVKELPGDLRTVLLVAHNPGVEDLVYLLSGESIGMSTSTLAVLTLPGTWADAGPATATLQAAGRPPLLA
ncbi:SixA phosphatase family protein [Cryobacterium arcticum]|uniref:Histidine phosphatase family protein n=1 Tax=Cryobacterium arcticum TaxID=670052 RepID=A0A317ZR28_9MICO|nr:histidine phosphatase family protein [Cryobacterium arcticum]PXA67214.1 histidine phosphatase family protein [Cryobacterium arcticum]